MLKKNYAEIWETKTPNKKRKKLKWKRDGGEEK